MQNELVESNKDNENNMTISEVTETMQDKTTTLASDAANKKAKFEKKVEINKQIINFLIQKFPLCFGEDDTIKPLKLGIFQDITENDDVMAQFSKTNLRTALRYYTMSWKYLEVVANGGDRFDLTGNQAGVVDEQQQKHASEQLAEAKAKVKARLNAKKANATNAKINRNKTDKGRNNNDNASFNKENKKNKQVTASHNKPKTPRSSTKQLINGSDKKNSDDKSVNLSQNTFQIEKNVNSKQITHVPLNENQLKIGALVNVLIGQSYTKAEILEINKENVRVILPTGLTLTVKIDNLSE